ncbi:hypothetical protein TNCV_2012151 [Trichonephila clavipes]|nr:hypothetical protein TNCV_2012151 [Trichonephila clavipes]
MVLRKGLTPDEIANLLRELSMNDLTLIKFPIDIRLNENDYEKSEERADVIDNIPINSDIYIDQGWQTSGTPAIDGTRYNILSMPQIKTVFILPQNNKVHDEV